MVTLDLASKSKKDYFLRLEVHDPDLNRISNGEAFDIDGPRNEVLTATRAVSFENGKLVKMDLENCENRALTGGDLPEAHEE